MAATLPTFDVNSKVAAAYGIPSDLGNLYETTDGKLYRLVKAAAAITANAGGTFVSTDYSGGIPTWSVSKTTTAADSACVGVVPSGISTLAASDHFFVQVTGNAQVQANATSVTNGDKIAPSTDGQAAAFAVTAAGDAINAVNIIGEATNTAGATAAGQLITADLRRVL